MAGMVITKTRAEEQLLLTLVQEFGPKVILPRRYTPSEVFKKYSQQGIYGITNTETDMENSEVIFEVALPPTYIRYIEYEIEKLRNFVSSAKDQNSNTQK